MLKGQLCHLVAIGENYSLKVYEIQTIWGSFTVNIKKKKPQTTMLYILKLYCWNYLTPVDKIMSIILNLTGY